VVDNSCKVFERLTWSVDDSLDTASQVRRHNAKFAKLCLKG
jgi:hypothetical protein